MKVDPSAGQVVSPRIIKSTNADLPDKADASNIKPVNSIFKGDIRKAQFSDLLNGAEKDLIQNLFTIDKRDKRIEEIKGKISEIRDYRYGQFGKSDPESDIQKTKGTIIDIVA
jgi:hypothetical protein